MTTFHDFQLSASLLKALDAMNIDTPTPIQVAAIPPLLERRDLIGQAATGSGKTLAFGLPLVQDAKPGERTPSALVVVPTRELAQQVGAVLSELIAGTGIRLAMVFGGRAIGPQEDAVRRSVQIIVGTPGRLVDLLKRGSLRLDRVRYLVLDEADEMLDHGFARDVERILSATPRERQTSLFSATTPDWVHKVSAKYLREPVVIELRAEQDMALDIDHVIYEIWNDDKFNVLRRLLDEPTSGGTLVFGRTKHGVRRLGLRLQRSGYRLGVLQGNLSQPQRDRVMRDFRAGVLMLAGGGKGDRQDLAPRAGLHHVDRRIFHRQSAAQIAVDPFHQGAFVGHRPLGDQIVNVVGPILNRGVATAGVLLDDDLDHGRVQAFGGVHRRGTAFDVVDLGPFVDDDQRPFELAHVLGVDAEVGLQGKFDLHALGHVDERAAGPDRRVERGELIVVGRNDLGEVFPQ